jgi:ABC-2 type transport system permease protein
VTATVIPQSAPVRSPAGFAGDVASVARRAVRSLTREPEFLAPALFIPVFFYVINIGSLQEVAEQIPGVDFKAFQLPVAIIFAVTGLSRANVLVVDIQSGYLDKLLVTPIRRLALLVGLMIADVVLAFCLSSLVVAMGFIAGVRFETGAAGVLAFLGFSTAWGLAFTGFPYAIALRTGNPAAVNTAFLLFFPFAFLTTAFLPLESLTSWLETIALWNPVTYLLDGMRSLITEGWRLGDLAQASAAITGIGAVSFTLAFHALRQRVARG